MVPIAIQSIANDDDRAYILALYQTAYRLMKHQIIQVTKNPQSADDLIQDTLVRLIPKIPLLRTLAPGQARVYAVRSAKAVAIDHMRKRSKEWTYYAEESGQFPEALFCGTENGYRQIESDDAFRSMLSLLGERDSDMLYYRYWLELGLEEIARLVGLGPQSINKALSRARNRLCQKLREQGVDLL